MLHCTVLVSVQLCFFLDLRDRQCGQEAHGGDRSRVAATAGRGEHEHEHDGDEDKDEQYSVV